MFGVRKRLENCVILMAVAFRATEPFTCEAKSLRARYSAAMRRVQAEHLRVYGNLSSLNNIGDWAAKVVHVL
jgi:hypothetical protein